MFNQKTYYLLSVDFEDVRERVPNGEKYQERVPLMTEKFLYFCDKHNCKITFFVVGSTAAKYPDLIKKIYDKGHEIACHTTDHKQLDKHTPESFRNDLKGNVKILKDIGIFDIKGFRAPTYSLTEKTKWAFDILKEEGFLYSSSVLPAKNPLFGWNDFGQNPVEINNLWEIPISIFPYRFLNIPFAGGVYFRVLPKFIINKACRKLSKNNSAILGYFHPYDIDTEQEKFMHPEINNNRFYNYLLFYNRGSVFRKIESIVKKGFEIIRYDEYVNKLNNKNI